MKLIILFAVFVAFCSGAAQAEEAQAEEIPPISGWGYKFATNEELKVGIISKTCRDVTYEDFEDNCEKLSDTQVECAKGDTKITFLTYEVPEVCSLSREKMVDLMEDYNFTFREVEE